MTAQSATQVVAASASVDDTRDPRAALLVVGYDGSPSSRRALETAADLLKRREGRLEVVFVAHQPATAPIPAEALAQLVVGFDEERVKLEQDAAAQLIHQPRPWRFQRRDGAVAAQLLAAADELHDRYGDSEHIAIVVGGPAHRLHHLVGSVSAGLARSSRFPVIVVP